LLFIILYSLIEASPLLVPWRHVRLDFLWLLLFVVLCLDFAILGYQSLVDWQRVFRHEAIQLAFPIDTAATFVVAVQILVVLLIRKEGLSKSLQPTATR